MAADQKPESDETPVALPADSTPAVGDAAVSNDVSAAPAPAAPQIVYVNAPKPPKSRGARGVGALVVLLSSLIFAGVYAALVLLLGLLAPPAAVDRLSQYFAAPTFWIPVIVFALGYLLLVVVINRAGWWAHVLGGFVVAVLVYVGFVGAVVIQAGAVGAPAAVLGLIVVQQLANPLGFAAAIAAREVPIWVGGLVALRGRSARARNAEARAAYQRELEDHRATVAPPSAV